MRKLILKMSISADGFVCGPHNELDWFFRTRNPAAAAWIVDRIGRAGAHLMGSRTYQDMVAYWPYSDEIFSQPMNTIPKIVFSRKGRLESPHPDLTSKALSDAKAAQDAAKRKKEADPDVLKGWLQPEVLGRDLAADIATLKERPGMDLVAHGGASFAQSLVALGLIDEFCLVVHPIAIGAGKSPFVNLPYPLSLKLMELKVFPNGALAKVYHPDRSET